MARVVWDRRAAIEASEHLIPWQSKPSQEDFRPPSRIETDFTRLLNHDVPHTNWSFELLRNWYYCWTVEAAELNTLTAAERQRMYENGTRILRTHTESVDPQTGETSFTDTYYALGEDGEFEVTKTYEPVYIRAQMTPIDWKSKIGNSDMSTNFKTDYTEPVQKGDYVVREDGALYMLNWNITTHPNNQATQAVECNAVVDITREFRDVTDEYGYLLEEGGRRPVCASLPISHSEYAGRPDYSGASQQAGMHPDHLISVYCQWNPCTRKIRLDDEFVIGDFTYRVINISLAEVHVDGDYGVLTINAKRVAGGTVNDYASEG